MLDTSTIQTDSERRAAVVAVVRLAGVLRREREALCQAHGLTLQQFNVLRILRGARHADEHPLPTMAVGERMIEPEPGITRLMGRLEDKGLVQRNRCPADARCVRCTVTDAGLALLEGLDAPMAALDAAAFTRLADADVGALLDLLLRALPDPSSPPTCPV